MTIHVLYNGRVFQSEGLIEPKHSFVDTLAYDDETGKIIHVGSLNDPEITSLPDSVIKEDIQGRFITPGFIDGHMHLLTLGQSLTKLSLRGCKDLEEIKGKLRAYAVENPDAKRILAGEWMHHMTGEMSTAKALEGVDPKGRPIYVESKDLHFQWCSKEALEEMGVKDMEDPLGGKIERDEEGVPKGLMRENAVMTIVWPFLARVASTEEKIRALDAAMGRYVAAGYTGMIEMAMDEAGWEAILAYREFKGTLPVWLAAYWCIMPKGDIEDVKKQVRRAKEVMVTFNRESSPDCYVTGIKFICDGVVDACTAALHEPYYTGTPSPDPIWNRDVLIEAVKEAGRCGLQVALHAIGDKTVSLAIEAIAAGDTVRPRIEHLEVTTEEDVSLLAKHGITASIHPGHADPAILREWPRLLGGDRLNRAFAYKEFAEKGTILAIGSDAPSAPLAVFPILYTATTRRSAREMDCLETVNVKFSLELGQAVTAATGGNGV